MTKILVVDDDAPLAHALEIGLGAHGFEVVVASDGAAAIVAASEVQPDVILLDLGLPRYSGMEVLTAIRTWSAVPVIVLSARHQGPSKVAALDAGADDYVTKPFGIEELLARIRAVLRRGASSMEASVMDAGDLQIDFVARRVERSGALVHLTPKEWGVLALLAKQPGHLVSHDELLTSVWGPGYEGEGEYLRTMVARLRRKIEVEPSNPRHLVTEPGVGYRFEQ